MHRLDLLLELVIGRAGEVLDLDEADPRPDQERLADAVGGNVVAHDGEVKHFVVSGPRHRDGHRRALRPLEPLEGLVDRHVERVDALDLRYHVPGANPRVERRRALEG